MQRPIKGLYELGVEIEENSELDLMVAYKAHAGDLRIFGVIEDMQREMDGKIYADLLERMAQFELTLPDINNSVPGYIYDEDIAGKFDYKLTDTFMGFHCGKELYEVFKHLGVADIDYSRPKNLPYPTENPWG